jgi:hypothetical protein
MNPRKEEFLMEGAIDPNTIRAKTDPDNARPTLSSITKHSYMPSSVKPGVNQHELIKTARASEGNWRNRFNPQGGGQPSAPHQNAQNFVKQPSGIQTHKGPPPAYTPPAYTPPTKPAYTPTATEHVKVIPAYAGGVTKTI